LKGHSSKPQKVIKIGILDSNNFTCSFNALISSAAWEVGEVEEKWLVSRVELLAANICTILLNSVRHPSASRELLSCWLAIACSSLKTLVKVTNSWKD